MLANTQVVEGLSVKELATSLQRALLEVPIGRQRDEAAGRGEVIRLPWLFGVRGSASLAAAQPAPPPELSALMAKTRVDGQLAGWCRGEFRAGRRNAFAAAVTSPAGGGRYLVLDADGTVALLAPFKGTPDLSCYTPAEARKLGESIRAFRDHQRPRGACVLRQRSSAGSWRRPAPCAGSIRRQRAHSSRSANGRRE